jgi:hypothetical protein
MDEGRGEGRGLEGVRRLVQELSSWWSRVFRLVAQCERDFRSPSAVRPGPLSPWLHLIDDHVWSLNARGARR